MKLLLLSLLAVMMMAGCSQTKNPSKSEPYEKEMAAYKESERLRINENNKIQAKSDSLCKQRGHVYGIKPDHFVGPGYSQYQYAESIRFNYDPEQLIDTDDSSYLVNPQASDFKYCKRCTRDIEFPKPAKYIKTIWRNENPKNKNPYILLPAR